MTARLVVASFNGKPIIFIDHIGLPSHEPKLRTDHETVTLTEFEATLRLDVLRRRWALRELVHQPKKVLKEAQAQ